MYLSVATCRLGLVLEVLMYYGGAHSYNTIYHYLIYNKYELENYVL